MPQTLTAGLRSLTAMAIPLMSPPPLMGTTTFSTWSSCSTISSPADPFPATAAE